MAQVYAVAGKDVVLVGRSDESLARAIDNVRASLADFIRHGLVRPPTPTRRSRASRPRRARARREAQLVIEAVTHDMPLKLDLFARLDRSARRRRCWHVERPAGERARRAVEHRERVIATHFWYPPQLIPLVEVCGSPETAPDVVPWVCAALRAAGKEPR